MKSAQAQSTVGPSIAIFLWDSKGKEGTNQQTTVQSNPRDLMNDDGGRESGFCWTWTIK